MIDASKFSWKGANGVAEMSDLGDPDWIRAYPDACDVGLELHSPTTGRVVRFVVYETERRDGDVVAWKLKPVNRRDEPLRLVIFND